MKNLSSLLNKNAEKIVFVLFGLLIVFVSFFHEPWFDELQAWEISKDSLYNILFVIPHLEGHPPLWHLILKCFSSLSISPELGVRIPNLLFMFGAVWLLIFKSPFSKVVRLLLPFTYFIFYQYSIISRPYSIFCFALLLCALFYKTRNENSFKFVGSLVLLSLSTAYGMFLTAGITIAWGIEVLKSLGIKQLIKDKRFYFMLGLFVFSLLLLLEIYPEKNIIAFADVYSYDKISKLLYSFFILSADATVFDFFNEMNLRVFFIDITNFFKLHSDIDFNLVTFQFWFGTLIGFVINVLLYSIAKVKSTRLFVFIPCIMFCLMAYLVYLKPHHIGLLTIFFVFAFWCMFSDEAFIGKKLKIFLSVFLSIFLILQIYWSISSALSEIQNPYSPSRQIVSFIKEHNMQNYKIMCGWQKSSSVYVNKETRKIYLGEPIDTKEKYLKFIQEYELVEYSNLLSQLDAVAINSYFDKNVFYNFNLDYPNKTYAVHKKLNSIETEELRQKWEKLGLPDFIIGDVDINYVFQTDVKNNYLLLKEFKSGFIWKDKYILTALPIYINKRLF